MLEHRNLKIKKTGLRYEQLTSSLKLVIRQDFAYFLLEITFYEDAN